MIHAGYIYLRFLKKNKPNVGKYMQIHHTSPILWEMISNISTKKKTVETDPKAAPEMLSFSHSSSATRSKQARLLFRMVSLNKRGVEETTVRMFFFSYGSLLKWWYPQNTPNGHF